MPIELPQVLQLIGQAPNQHGIKTAIENLRASKSLFPMFGMNGKLPPQMQEMMDKVMKDGPMSMIQNPMAAIGGAVQGQIGGIAGQLAGVAGGGGMLAALTGGGGLQAAMGTLMGTATSLVGLPGGMGNFDINSVMGHASLMGLGTVPAGMSLDRVLGPVFSGTLVGTVSDTLHAVAADVAGGGNGSGFIGEVLQHVADVNGVVNNSVSALTQGLQVTSAVSAISILADGLDPTRGDHPLLDFFQSIVLPEAMGAIEAHHEQMAAEAPFRSGRNADGTIPDYTPPEGLEEP